MIEPASLGRLYVKENTTALSRNLLWYSSINFLNIVSMRPCHGSGRIRLIAVVELLDYFIADQFKSIRQIHRIGDRGISTRYNVHLLRVYKLIPSLRPALSGSIKVKTNTIQF